MGAFNQLNGAIFDAGAIEARISAIDGRSIYNQRDGGILDFDSLARRLTALDGKVAVGQGGIEFDVDSFMRRLAAIEAGVFTPLQFFANGEQGGWWDPSDFTTQFQDSAGTTPVTAVGQPVGKILDKSGRGNHVTQPTTTSRPTVQQDAGGSFYWSLDGVDDTVFTSGVMDMSASDKATLWVAVRRNSDAALSVIAELSTQVGLSNPGSFVLHGSSGGVNYLSAVARTALNQQAMTGASAAPQSDVISQAMDFSASGAAEIAFKLNGGTSQPGSGTDAGTGNFGTYQFFMGARAGTTFPLNGRIYQMILRGGLSNASQIAAGTTFVGAKMGVSL